MSTKDKTMIATPVVKNKFWIVERAGQKIATIQAIDEGGFVYVAGESRQKFASIKAIKDHYNISISFKKKETEAKKPSARYSIYGFPADSKPHSEVFNVQKKLPIYSKNDRSKSFYCAGYYLIKFNNQWIKEFCPKLITLNRYPFIGPWATAEEQELAFQEKKND